MESISSNLKDNYEQVKKSDKDKDSDKDRDKDKKSVKKQTTESENKVESIEFNTKFEQNILDILTSKYKILYYGIYSLQEYKIINIANNSTAVTNHIKNNLQVTSYQVDVVEYQSPVDILLDGALTNGAIAVDVKYKNLSIFTDTFLLDDYKYGTTVKDNKDFIEDYKKKIKEYYLICLAHIFETMKMDD